MTDLRACLQTIANIAEYGARSADPIEAQAAGAILRRDLPRGLAIGGRPSYADSRDPR
jgi:hypothetical protein